MALTISQRTNNDGFPKPGELIKVKQAFQLEANDRALINILYEHAHNSGNIGVEENKWMIKLKDIRMSNTNNNQDLYDSIRRIMSTILRIDFIDSEGKERHILTNMFEIFDLPSNNINDESVVYYKIPIDLLRVLVKSNHWGRIKSKEVCGMTSKYAVQLYEFIQLVKNRDKPFDKMTITEFREMMNVPPDSYKNGKDFVKFVIEPALLEVNGLSDMAVDIRIIREHSRAPITEVYLEWWEKDSDEYRKTLVERKLPKKTRLKRLKDDQSPKTI